MSTYERECVCVRVAFMYVRACLCEKNIMSIFDFDTVYTMYHL